MQKKAILLGSVLLLGSAAAMADGLNNGADDSLYSSNTYVGLQTGAYYTGNTAVFYNAVTPNTSINPQSSRYGMVSGVFTGLGTNFSNFYLGTELGASFQPRPGRSVNPGTGGDVLFYNPYQFYADIIPGVINGTWLYFARLGAEGDVYQLDQSGTSTQKFAPGLRGGLGIEDRVSEHVTLKAGATFMHTFPFEISTGAGTVSAKPYDLVGNVGMAYHFGDSDWSPMDESPELLPSKNNDIYYKNFYTGVQSGVYYTQDFKGFSDGVNPSAKQSQNQSIGLVNGLYAGLGTDFDNGFYIGSEVGASVQARPDHAGASGAAGSVLYAPYQFYADIMPGLATESGTLFFARLGVEGDHEVFDRFSSTGVKLVSQTKFSPGLRAGLGIEDKLCKQLSIRVGGTFIDMFKIQMGSMTAHPYDVVGNVGIAYHFK